MSQRHPIHHPPVPPGATKPELRVIERLHRAGMTSDDEASRPAMLDGVALLVELILARNKRQSLTDQWTMPRPWGGTSEDRLGRPIAFVTGFDSVTWIFVELLENHIIMCGPSRFQSSTG